MASLFNFPFPRMIPFPYIILLSHISLKARWWRHNRYRQLPPCVPVQNLKTLTLIFLIVVCSLLFRFINSFVWWVWFPDSPQSFQKTHLRLLYWRPPLFEHLFSILVATFFSIHHFHHFVLIPILFFFLKELVVWNDHVDWLINLWFFSLVCTT